MFARFDSRYDLHGRLMTLTALHIGAGGSLAVVGSDHPVVRDVNGFPYIPGSSFKGVLRSTIEALVRTVSPAARQEPWACDPLVQNAWCIPSSKIEEWQAEVRAGRLSQDQLDDRVVRSSCTVCRVFGSPWLASKVKVADLYLYEGTNWLGRVEVRDGVAIDRDTETVSGGRKYDFEVVPRETTFSIHVRVDNASNEELGLLFLGLREFMNGGAWIGGNTSRGLGLVRIEWGTLERIEGRNGLLQYLRHGYGQRETDPRRILAFITEKISAFLTAMPGGQGSDKTSPTESAGRNHA